MNKQYIIIALSLICIIGIMIVGSLKETLPSKEQKESEAYMREMSKQGRAVRAQFDNMVAYCKEHEEALMKVSKVFLEQHHEDITWQEINEIAQNNTSPEWTELSKRLTLEYPTTNDEFIEKSVYYLCDEGGGSALYIVYMNAGDEKIYGFGTGSYLCGTEEKINDNLYVCILHDPMLGL